MSTNETEYRRSLVAPPTARSAPNRWMLPLLLSGQAMAAMDTSIANVAAPVLRTNLGVSGALLQLVVGGYVLTYAVFLITAARLGDNFGYRRLFVIGVGLFTVSSLLCGLAVDAFTLIAGRIAQGLGAALLVPQVLSLIQKNFEGNARARAIGFYSMILGLGATAGQLLGGVAVTLDIGGLSWRSAFLINVPIGILLLLFARTGLPEGKGEGRSSIDSYGVVLLSLSLLLIVGPLTFGQEAGWQSWIWICLALGAFGISWFWRYESAVTRASDRGTPLINVNAVLTPGIRPGLLVVAFGFIGYGGWLFAAALYLQSGLGYSAMISGSVFAAYALGFGVANVNWSKLPPNFLHWTPTAALVVMFLVNLAFGATAIVSGWTPIVMVPLLFLAGASHGLAFGTTVHQMTIRMPDRHAPALSGLVTSAVQLSIVIGIAALGALYFSTIGRTIETSASLAIAVVTFAIATGAVVALACSIRLALLPIPLDTSRS